MSKKWTGMLNDSGRPHVYPIDDLRPHDIEGECWCKPTYDEGVVVHHSMDRREEFEKAAGKIARVMS